MKYLAKICQEEFLKLRNVLLRDMPRESAAFVLAGSHSSSHEQYFLARKLVKIPRSEYDIQEQYRLRISSRAINGLAALCEASGLGVLLCHSHSIHSPYSPTDDEGELRIANALRDILPGIPVASLLVSPTSVQGRVWPIGSRTPVPISTLVVLGRHLSKMEFEMKKAAVLVDLEVHGRQVLALGKEGQAKISSTKVAIVGTGGTGSATAEQLVRLGVKDFVLIDMDTYERSNKSRIYGSFSEHCPTRVAGTPKIDIVAAHLQHIESSITVRTSTEPVMNASAYKMLLDRDIIFLCTDEHWGRSIVNQICYQYLIPTINMGMRIDSQDGQISHAIGSVHILRPGTPCLWCTQFLSADRIRAESLPTNEREELLREGYVEGLSNPAPSLIPFTTEVAAIAVRCFLQLTTDFMGSSGDIQRVNVSFTEGTSRRGRSRISDNCMCGQVLGFGDHRTIPGLPEKQESAAAGPG